MANLTFLNEASVLHNLRQRYASMIIYVTASLEYQIPYIIDLLRAFPCLHKSVQDAADLYRFSGEYVRQ